MVLLSAFASNPLIISQAGRVRILYSLFFTLLLPLILLRLYLRSRKSPAYRQRILERFGFGANISGPTIWVHAVSVGEVQAAKPLISRLQQQYPEYTILVTTMTPTGAERVADINGKVVHRYVPYDTPGCINRFLSRSKPSVLIVMETEIWPNMLHYCRKQHIATVLVNARMSARSARGYARFAKLTASALQNFSQIAVQNQTDEERLIKLGANPATTHVTGSLKFDFNPPADIQQSASALREQWGVDRKVWIAASTHKGEDEIVLEAFAQLREHLPEALLVLVPRHPERFNAVATLCQSRGFELVRRSERRVCTADTAIFLGDSMGELMLFFAASDIAFVGGSLVATGGHNLLEPASLGLPILTGPHMFNFTDIHQLLLQAEASIEVESSSHLAKVLLRLFADKALCQSMGEKGRQRVIQNRGALERVMVLVDGVMDRPK